MSLEVVVPFKTVYPGSSGPENGNFLLTDLLPIVDIEEGFLSLSFYCSKAYSSYNSIVRALAFIRKVENHPQVAFEQTHTFPLYKNEKDITNAVKIIRPSPK